ncbi:MAG TPA: YbhB/YbcL family Raf kinase inhibitor-like protein [Terriglobales bacterium]|nr:YbhB/YbcL family Raf kinase inhibitor-like protein [Terriglobales bacterium]
MSLQVSTTSFPAEGTIPKRFTCSAEDVSPALTWTGVPPTTQSLALIVDDPDAPAGTWTHWLVYNLPAAVHELAENQPRSEQLPNGAVQGRNDFRKIGYNGPCPPSGKPHRYFFRVFAIDAKLDLKPGANRQPLDQAMQGHIVAQGEVMGKFAR